MLGQGCAVIEGSRKLAGASLISTTFCSKGHVERSKAQYALIVDLNFTNSTNFLYHTVVCGRTDALTKI